MNPTLSVLLLSGLVLALLIMGLAGLFMILDRRRQLAEEEMDDVDEGHYAEDDQLDADQFDDDLAVAAALDVDATDDPPLNETVEPDWVTETAPAALPEEPEELPPAPEIEPEPSVPSTPAPPPSQPFTPAAQPGAAAALNEALRVFQGPTGELLVQLDNTLYLSPAALQNPAERARLANLLASVQNWLNSTGDTPAPAGPLTAPISISSSKPATEGSESVIKLSAREAAQRPITPPSWNLGQQIGRLRQMNTDPKVEIKTMLEEMDDLLQTSIANTPWVMRGLRITEAPDGALNIRLDGQTFDGIEQLNDHEAQQLIRAAIAAWEKSN